MDTVGFHGAPRSAEEHEKEFCAFSSYTPDGVDVFLLTEKYGRFLEAQKHNFQMFKEFVGREGALKHTILVFTHIQNSKLQEQLSDGSIPQELKDIVEQVRCVVGVESKLDRKRAQVDVLKAMRDVTEKNERRRYDTVTTLRNARYARETLMGRIKKLKGQVDRTTLEAKRRELYIGATTYEDLCTAIKDAERTERLDASRSKNRQATCLPCCCTQPL